MPYEMTVGLQVDDQALYTQYRTEMTPLLERAGGAFRYDFEVSRTLKAEAGHDVNRVFVLQFPDREASRRFFADPVYLEIRARLFEQAVSRTAIIAEYERGTQSD
jgi:uncharacterized protein (DUF1330 family)